MILRRHFGILLIFAVAPFQGACRFATLAPSTLPPPISSEKPAELEAAAEEEESEIDAASDISELKKKFNHPVPERILTPSIVDTRIGRLQFFDGLPSDDTAKKVFEQLDFSRGVEAFLNFTPAASLEAMRVGSVQAGVTVAHDVLIFDELMDSTPLFLTGNTDTVYASAFLDLERDGPTVVEVPSKCGPGTVNDAFFRFVTDMGPVGPDKGKGGKYLILPPDFDGKVPRGYHVSTSESYVNWLILRGFLVDGKPDDASRMFREGLKIYPLSEVKNPPKMNFIEGSKKPINTVHSNNFEFFTEVDRVIQKEPLGLIEPELRGLLSSIGIQKGRAFSPDERMKKILEESAVVGNATARSLFFQSRDPQAFLYEGSEWKTAFVGQDYQWLKDGGQGGRYLDARTLFFYIATVNTPAMAVKMIGRGSQYALVNKDSDKNFLKGGENYLLRLPANVPVEDFWSVVLYDPQTRSQLQTSQPFPSKNSSREELLVNEDGTVDLFFGPQAPKGKEANWIETVPGKGWFAILRLYGPRESWFDRSWQPGEIQLRP